MLPSGCVCYINLQVWNTSNMAVTLNLIYNIIVIQPIIPRLISLKVDLTKLASQCPDPASPMSMQWIIGSRKADGCDVMATTCFGPQVTQHCSGKKRVLGALSCSPNWLSPLTTTFLLHLVRTARLHAGSKESPSGGSEGTSRSSFLVD